MADFNRRLADLSDDKRSLLERVLRREGRGGALPIRARGEDARELPLAFGQESLWFMGQLAADASLYNLPSAVRLSGRLDRAALHRALAEIVRRHEILRTRFPAPGGRPIQDVAADLAPALPLVDLAADADPAARARVLAAAEAARPFDLAEGPLFRFTLYRLGDDDHVLGIVFHHLVWDGWSIGVLSRELCALYQAYAAGASSPLPELPIQYADYALWQRAELAGDALEEQLAYWRARLAGHAPSPLPTDRPRPREPSFAGGVCPVALPADLVDAVERIGARRGATLFMTLLSLFEILLSRWCGQDRVVVGTPVANRSRAEVEGLIGHFANLVVMTGDLRGGIGFEDLCGRTKDVVAGAFAHAEIPFELLVDKLGIARDPSKNPIFQIVFALHMERLDGMIELPGLGVTPFAVSSDRSHFDLGLHLWRTPDGAAGYVSYNRDLFEPATVERLVGHYRALLQAVVAAPDAPIAGLPMLTEAEERWLAERERGTGTGTGTGTGVEPEHLIDLDAADLASVTVVGGFLRPELVEAFHRRSTADLLHAYRPPEVGDDVYVARALPGAPIAGQPRLDVRILDARGRLVPIGVPGTVHVRVGDAWIETRDRALWQADGALRLVGAEDRHVLREGVRVCLDDIETALLRHPAVDACRVIARVHEGRERIVAYVVPSGTFDPAPLRESLPPAARPSDIVPLTALPRMPEGFVDEPALAAFEVIDDELMARWQARLEAGAADRASGAGARARVIAVEPLGPDPLLHVSDLLPGYRPSRAVERTTSTTSGTAATSAGARLAITFGGPLEVPPDAPRTLPAALLRTAATYPDHGVRIVHADGRDTFLSYADLLRAARCVLAGLREAGLGPGAEVILQLDDLAEYFASLWGCLLGGVVPVTVSTTAAYDRKGAVLGKLYNTWELLRRPPVIASDALVEPLAGVAALYRNCSESAARTSCDRDDGERFRVMAFSALSAHAPAERVHEPAPDDLAFLQLTSGSTGVPKCIQETHRACIHHILGVRQMHGFGPDQVHLNWLPMDHSVPILLCHIKDTYLGIQQVHAKPEVVLGDPLAWLDMMERYRVTHTWSPNFGYKLVNDALAKSPDRKWDLSSFVYTMNGAEQVVPAVAEEFVRLLSPFGVRPSVMVPAFGMAELATGITYNKEWDRGVRAPRVRKASLTGVLEPAADDDPDAIAFICVGRPLPGVEIRIVDGDNRVLPESVIGVLQIRSPCVTAGYLHNEEANREVFVGDGWFSSGDLGFIADGRLTITGRQKEMIVVRGANYYCYEIEDAVSAVDGVEPTFVAACAVDDPAAGTDGLAIFFVPKVAGIDLPLLTAIREKVTADFGLAPVHVLPIAMESFPKTTSGKVQRTQLKKELVSGRFDDVLRRIDLALGNDETMPGWFFRPAWTDVAITATRPRRTLVIADDEGLGAAVVDRLGEAAALLRPGDYGALDGGSFESVLHLRTYGEPAAMESVADLERAQREGAFDVLALAQALGRDTAHPVALLVASSHTQRRRPEDALAPERAPVRGLCKSIAHEWPHIAARHVDLPHGDPANVDRLAREIGGVTKDWEIMVDGDRRLARRLEHVDLRPSGKDRDLPWKKGDLVLVTGGLGGVGAVLAKHLLEEHDARVILVGRTPLDREPDAEGADSLAARRTSAELRKALADLERAGGEVVYEVGDVADEARVREIVARAEARFGRELAGAIHLGGVFPTRLLSEETSESLWETLRPKLGGAFVLARILRPEAFLVAFDTVYSTFGGVAVGGYAAANAGMAAVVRGKGGVCLAWSHWDETGMSRGYQLREQSIASGYRMIRPRQGLASFLCALRRGERDLLIGVDGRRPNVRRHLDATPAPVLRLAGYTTGSVPAPSDVADRFGTRSSCEVVALPELPLTPSGELDRARLPGLGGTAAPASKGKALPESELERTIAAAWREVLGLDAIDIDTSFFALGGQSILLIQLLAKLKRSVGADLTVVDLFRHPTIRTLAAHLGTAKPDKPSFARVAERAKAQQEAMRRRAPTRGRPSR